MVSYFYKNQYKGIVSYINCQWLNEIDLYSTDLTKPICKLTLTNISDFYKNTITFKDLDDFKKSNIPIDILGSVIQAGLQGEQQYQGDVLNWKTVYTEAGCKMTLIGYWNNSLPVQVGTFFLPQVTTFDNNKELWEGWLEETTKEFTKLKESQVALIERNKQLEKNYKECESMANNLAVEKQDNERTLFEKFMMLLNNKKRKIKKLQQQLKKYEILESSTVQPISSQSAEHKASTKNKKSISKSPLSASQPKLNTSSSQSLITSINVNRLERTMPVNISSLSSSISLYLPQLLEQDQIQQSTSSKINIKLEDTDDDTVDDTEDENENDSHESTVIKVKDKDKEEKEVDELDELESEEIDELQDNDGDDDDDFLDLLAIVPKVKRKAANPRIMARKRQKEININLPVIDCKNDTDDDEGF